MGLSIVNHKRVNFPSSPFKISGNAAEALRMMTVQRNELLKVQIQGVGWGEFGSTHILTIIMPRSLCHSWQVTFQIGWKLSILSHFFGFFPWPQRSFWRFKGTTFNSGISGLPAATEPPSQCRRHAEPLSKLSTGWGSRKHAMSHGHSRYSLEIEDLRGWDILDVSISMDPLISASQRMNILCHSRPVATCSLCRRHHNIFLTRWLATAKRLCWQHDCIITMNCVSGGESLTRLWTSLSRSWPSTKSLSQRWTVRLLRLAFWRRETIFSTAKEGRIVEL